MARPLLLLAVVAGSTLAQTELGSRACQPCHAEIFRTFSTTPMARSSGPAGSGVFRESLSQSSFAAGATQYEVSSGDKGLEFGFRRDAIEGRRRLDYFIGSGSVGRSYLSWVDRFLFQAPISYYSEPGRWDLSPGFDAGGDINLTRPVETGCLRCHASRLQPVAGSVNAYEAPPFLEPGVSCERCHGPGQDHVRAKQAGVTQGGSRIVNPARLEAARRDSVCAQCHLSGEAEIARAGVSIASFRPGQLLSDSVIVFVREGDRRQMPVISHYERMMQSGCRQAAGDRFWCGSCHDPHREPPENRSAYYRSRCLACHTATSCTGSSVSRAAHGDSCTACHMSRASVQTVRHAAFTDHSIPRIPRAAAPAASSSDSALIPFDKAPSGERELGLAYASVALRDNHRASGMRAFALLRQVHDRLPKDAAVATQLAQLYDRMGNEQKACETYARAVAADPGASAAAVNLGGCLAKQGRMEEAITLWQDALRRNIGLESARLNLAVAQYQAGRIEEARGVLQEALRVNPASRRARELLAGLDGRPLTR